ncbi:MAG: TfoX/Sxy family protein [Planctomycetes bacterium]|nr:TfoX/Sxy family protein [Planctomycetota bacterium]
MAYDEKLAERIRKAIGKNKSVTEKKMFGGVAFLHDGRMFLGVLKDELMARVGPQTHEGALEEPGARVMDFTGKPMLGYVFVEPKGHASDADLKKWVKWTLDFVVTLPAKKQSPKRKRASVK